MALSATITLIMLGTMNNIDGTPTHYGIVQLIRDLLIIVAIIVWLISLVV